MKKTFFAIIFVLSATLLKAQYTVISANDTVMNQCDGISYFLPQNVLKITFNIKETHYFIGPYVEYADEILETNDYIKEDRTICEIVGAEIETYSVADPNARFYVTLNEKTKEQGVLNFSLTEDGIIQAFGYDSYKSNITQKKMESIDFEEDIATFANPEFIDFIVSEKDIEDLYDSMDVAKKVSKEDKALLIKKMIEKTRSAYFDLVTGFQEVAYGNALNNMAELTQNIEYEYISLFKGKKVVKNYKKSVIVTPEANQINSNMTVAKFDANSGFLPVNAKNGVAIKLQFETPKVTVNQLNADLFKKSNSIQNKLVYRTPASVVATLAIDDNCLTKKQLKINQFGSLLTVPMNNYKLEFNPNTGQLISINR